MCYIANLSSTLDLENYSKRSAVYCLCDVEWSILDRSVSNWELPKVIYYIFLSWVDI